MIVEQSPTACNLRSGSFGSPTVLRRRPVVPSIMPPLRRLSALLLGLLFLQLTLVGDGGACRSHAMRRGALAIAAMPMGHMNHDGTPSPHKACGTERAAGDCASMASCAVTLSLPTLSVASGPLVPAAAALPEPVSIRSGPSAGPDVPPPRG